MDHDQKRQYDHLTGEYVSLARVDPAKRYLQYPEALRLLGPVSGLRLLDIGCGDGTFTRMLARCGARVVAYDPSPLQIAAAREQEKREGLGIAYFLGDRPEIPAHQQFDKAVSVMVLLYATDKGDLFAIFNYVHKNLKNGGSFLSITYNPAYQRTGKVFYNRRFSKVAAGEARVDFFDGRGNLKISAAFTDFASEDFEEAARKAGFASLEWLRLQITGEGRRVMGENFWRDFENDPPYIGLRVLKG